MADQRVGEGAQRNLPTAPKPQRMTTEELGSFVAQEIRRAIGGTLGSSRIARERAQALRDFHAERLGNEREGRSQVVLADVRDTVLAIMPDLLSIFFATTDPVRFEAQNREDEKGAQQRTDLCNWTVVRDNPGFMVFYSWFLDALVQKLGVVKAWVEHSEEAELIEYEGKRIEELLVIFGDEDVEIEAASSRTEMQPDALTGELVPTELWDVEVALRNREGRIKIAAIPPEEFIVSPDARSIEDATLVGHRRRVREGELVGMGFDPAVVRAIPDAAWNTWDEETAERDEHQDDFSGAGETLPGPSRWLWVTESYVRVDFDHDGSAELRRVIMAGDGDYVIENRSWTRAPFAAICPVPMPHRLFGLSITDLVRDLQVIRTAVLRGYFDAVNLATDPRPIVTEGAVNMDDLLTQVPGHPIRERTPNAVRYLETPTAAPYALQALEFTEQLKEQRSGVSRYYQGNDPNTLNKTARGIELIQQAANKRIEMIARIFAETGVKQLFLLVQELYSTHDFRKRTIRLRNEWTEIDPTDWREQMDCSVMVGLGTGDRSRQVQFLFQILDLQGKLNEAGMGGVLVKPENVYAVLRRAVDAEGFKDAGLDFFTDPAKAGPAPPPPPDPKLLEIESRERIELAKLEQEAALAREKMALEHQAKMAALRVKTAAAAAAASAVDPVGAEA